MIYTGSYAGVFYYPYKKISISGDRGRGANFNGEYFKELAPKLSFWKVWHDNIGIIDEIKNNKYYIRQYYNEVLSKLNCQQVYDALDNSILLCYEEVYKFCHRHIVSAWFELVLGKKVDEIRMVGGQLYVLKKPEYIKDYLKEIIDKN